MKKVFVTGAPGWLGSRFVELLSQRQVPGQAEVYDIRCLVMEGMDGAALEKMGAQVVFGNIVRAESLKGAMQGCDLAIHMAGIVHPRNVKEFYTINTLGTQNVLDAAIQAEVKRLVFISSNSPAGFSSAGKPFTETDVPMPYMHYGQSKYRAEQIILGAVKEKRIEAVILRPCWFYGPGQPDRQTEFFRMIKKGSPILFGDGHSSRSMSYIDNVIQAIVLAMSKEGINGELYWIADQRPYEMLEVYETIAKLVGTEKLKPIKVPALTSALCEAADRILQSLGIYHKKIHVAGEMARNIACSIEKAQKELNYQPQISLHEGMKRSLEWCRLNHIDI